MRTALGFFGILSLVGCTLEANLNSVDFGTIYVGEARTSAPIAWTNTGRNAVDVIGLAVTLPGPGTFTIAPAGFTAVTLQPNQALNPITVTFAPSREGTYSGTMEPLANTGPNSTVTSETVHVRGQAVFQIAEGDVGLSGNAIRLNQPIDFGSVRAVAGPARTIRVEVLNLRNQAITVNGRILGGNQGFTIAAPAMPLTIPAQSSAFVTLSFLPGAVGDFQDAVEFAEAGATGHRAGNTLVGRGVE